MPRPCKKCKQPKNEHDFDGIVGVFYCANEAVFFEVMDNLEYLEWKARNL